MVFVREQKRANGNVYLIIQQSYRDKKGRPKSRYLEYIGIKGEVCEDQIDRKVEEWKRKIKKP